MFVSSLADIGGCDGPQPILSLGILAAHAPWSRQYVPIELVQSSHI